MRVRALVAVVVALVVGGVARAGLGQMQVSSGDAVGGVAITTEGLLHIPKVAAGAGPGGMVRAGDAAAKREAGMVYVSLPGVVAEARKQLEAGKPLTGEIKTLHGLTQIQYVFVYPSEHDLVIAGPGEGVRGAETLMPVGTATGRPVVQFEDLVVAFRAVYSGGDGKGGKDVFGCSIDPAPGQAEVVKGLVATYGTDRPRLVAEMKKQLGPQQVRVFGVPGDSRVGLAMVAADYRLKRVGMGLDVVPGVGSALGADGSARMWFRPSYEPLGVSADGLGYAVHGRRLEVMVGENWASPSKEVPAGIARFAKQFTEKMPAVASRVEAVADLQNVTDLFLVAALVKGDGLAEKAGVDLSWMLDGGKLQVAKVTVPRTAETLVTIGGNELVSGGVAIAGRQMRGVGRGGDGTVLASVRRRPEGGAFLVETQNSKLKTQNRF